MALLKKQSLGAKALVHTTPVVLIATYDELGVPNAMTAASLGFCSMTPPTLTIAVRPETFTHKCLTEARALTLNFPSQELLEASDFIGSVTGQEIDKFRSAKLTAVRSELVNAPLIDECKMSIECTVTDSLNVGSHTLFIVEVLDLKVSPEIVSSNGSIDLEALLPVLYSTLNNSYLLPGEAIGAAGLPGAKLKEGPISHLSV